MKFYSTNLSAKEVNIEEAILNGLAEDKGLYMPDELPSFSSSELESLKDKEYSEIAFSVLNKFLSEVVDEESLRSICKDAYDFDVPLEKLHDSLYIMRLDCGPTAAFKDFAAQAMSRIMQYFLKKSGEELLILTATSGDTGSAVANAFNSIDNIKVVVLFPDKEVTERQRKLMTTLGDNITAISVDGKFDDCQALVKDAFVDPDLTHLSLSSANSINFARLMPQIVYYVYASLRLGRVNFSVPSGNFGDLMGGLIAKKMSADIDKFIVAVNSNDEFVNFYQTGDYSKIDPSKSCISNAMNVGHPSNLSRLVALYGGVMDEKGNIKKMPDMDAIKNDMVAVSVTDQQTKEEIKKIYNEFDTVVEPHGAVGLYAYDQMKEKVEGVTVSLETAHPAKFPEVVNEVISVDPELPDSMKSAMQKEEKYEKMDKDYSKFKEFLLDNFSK